MRGDRTSTPSLDFFATAVPPRESIRAAAVTTVVLRSRPGDSTFRDLNPTSRTNRTVRTSLLARLGDSVIVVATRSHSGQTGLPRSFLLTTVPPYVRAALDGAHGTGLSRGLYGPTVAYAAQPTLAPGWALVREMETDEFEARIHGPLVVQALIFGALAMLLGFAAVTRARAIAGRQERELARLRTEFVASASHELRTPLAQIRLFSELLRTGGLRTPADTERALRVIADESLRLSSLVDNLLTFASLRRSAESAPGETCDIADEASQLLADFAPLARERHATISAHLVDRVPARVNPDAFGQVLINYLDNALKYGGVDQTITVRVWQSAHTANVSVEDQGAGIPGDERERVWQAFYRRAGDASSAESGSGLGLAVVRDLVLQCGGACESRRGRVAARDSSPSSRAHQPTRRRASRQHAARVRAY